MVLGILSHKGGVGTAAYRRASDAGHSLNETPFRTLNHRAQVMAESIMKQLVRRAHEQKQETV
jgi:hypothetical protein